MAIIHNIFDPVGKSVSPGTDVFIIIIISLLGEALHLSRDFDRLCANNFPHVELAQIIARQHIGTPEAQHRISMVKATQ